MMSEDLNIDEVCEECEIHYSDEEVQNDIPIYEEKPSKSKWALKGRFRSWALWLAVAGLISVLGTTLGLWERLGVDSETFDAFASALGSVLVAFGILNNPTDSEGF